MKANEKTILRFLESSDTKFTVPIYQRRYSWNIDEAKRLFDDILKVIENKLENHFLGSIVTVYNDIGSDREYLIIDGQQRITSVTLILLAIYKIIDKGLLVDDTIIKDRILHEYIINQYSSYDDLLKLNLKESDLKCYVEIYNDINSEEISKVNINYSYFYNRILKGDIKISTLIDAIKKLSIIEIELKLSSDNPQLIFEGLNSTGRNLTEVDKIRNLNFMNMDIEKQKKLYIMYFSVIENLVGSNMELFLKDYLSIKERKVISSDTLYINFKEFLYAKDIECVLFDIKSYAGYFNACNTEGNSYGISLALENLKLLCADKIYVFLMELINDFNKNDFDKNTLSNILDILESYMLRRIVCKIPSNSIYKFLLAIIPEIKTIANYKKNYFEIFKFILLKQVDSLRFPRDIEFKRAFFESDLYRLKNENLIYILEKLENYKNKETIDIKGLLENNSLSIEHIMPQKLTSKWKISLGTNYEEIHSKYLHTIANLTLTAYNSNMSNKTFIEKCHMNKGFAESRLKLNRFIASRNKFTEKELLERAILLFDDAKGIWPSFISKYKLSGHRKLLYYLSDDIKICDFKINGFIFEGVLRKAKSFKEIFDITLNILYDIEPLLLSTIIKNAIKIDFLAFKLADNDIFIKNSYKILNGVYSDIHLSDNARIKILRGILELYSIDIDELSFYVEK